MRSAAFSAVARRRLAGGGALVVTVGLLAGCGGSSKALLPTENAGALQNDFANVEQFVSSGNCVKALGWVAAAQRDLAALPTTVDAALHAHLQAGVLDLAAAAQRECSANASASSSATTSATTSTSSSEITSSVSQTTETATSSVPSTTVTTPSVTVSTSNPAGGVAPVTSSSAPPVGGGQAPPAGGGGGNGVGGAGAP